MKVDRVLITGNMGYVGPAVVRRLRERFPDARLFGIDTCFFGHYLTSAVELPESLLDGQYFMDIRDMDAELLQGIDAVVSLAAVSNDPMGKAFEAATMAINHRATQRLAELARDAGVRSFVMASSCSVYGAAGARPRREDDPVNPLTAYARSKLATEAVLERLATDDFVVTCLRFPTACGMSPRLRLDLVLNDFVASALALGRIDVLSDGSPWRPLIDTADMASAIEWSVARPAERGGRYLAVNVGREGINYRIRDLAEAVAQQMPGVEVNINSAAPPDARSYQVDFSRYTDLAPDHLPSKSLEDSIRELIAGLEGMKFTDGDFRRSQLIRLQVLSALQQRGELDSGLRWTRASCPPTAAAGAVEA